MSTIWDDAVRAANETFREVYQLGERWAGSPVSYYCGGPERRCTHRSCTVVCALAERDMLAYDTAGTVDRAQRDQVASVVLEAASGAAGVAVRFCHDNPGCTHLACAIVRSLLDRDVLASATTSPCGCIDILCEHRGLDLDGGPYDVKSTAPRSAPPATDPTTAQRDQLAGAILDHLVDHETALRASVSPGDVAGVAVRLANVAIGAGWRP